MLNAIYVFCFVTVAGLSFVDREVTEYRTDREYKAVQAQMDAFNSWDQADYFPRGRIHRFHAHSASYFLFHMDEPILKQTVQEEGFAVVRLTVIASFGPMFVFRVEEQDGVYSITRKVGMTTYGGWGPVEMVYEREVQISKNEFDTTFEAAQLASVSKSTHSGWLFDGANWVLETAGRTPYRVTREQSPDVAPWYELVHLIRGALPPETTEMEAAFEFWQLGIDSWPKGLEPAVQSPSDAPPLLFDVPPASSEMSDGK